MALSDKHLGGYGYYGYTYRPETDEYEVNEKEATVIKLISILLALGYPLVTVAETMNTLGVRVPSGKSENEMITTTWIRRKFGLYKRKKYSKKDWIYDSYTEDVVPYKDYFEKYNGDNGFPQILGNELYAYVKAILSDLKFRRRYEREYKIGIYSEENEKLLIKDIKNQVSLK